MTSNSSLNNENKNLCFVLHCPRLYISLQANSKLLKQEKNHIENIPFDKTNYETIQIHFNHRPDSKEYNHGSPGA